ncbi:MAG: Ig-like domain-containing protein [Melioribacteraceae bacterium]|nr:Ig-like domain-containing protein [Melioribacteraceae bacterium]
MRKLLLINFLILILTYNINAQSLAGVKVCINPGHGGNDSDDRFIPETGFWESEGNLGKGLHLKKLLENLGATVIMTRVQNRSVDDLQLSQIVAIANSNNVDYFHSIHSNASGTSTKVNYTLILFQGRTTAPTYAGSLVMANYLADNILATNRTTRKMVAGDFDFYGTGQAYLGVFKGLNMPGTLSEGSFHDYIPESFRLKNDYYLKHEAYAIARSFLQYFKGGEFKTGIIAGIVRDLLEKVPSSYSPLSGTYDNYKTINNIKVTLLPTNKIYNGDNNNNGFYFFDEVDPGEYKLIFEAPQMRPDTVTIVAKANQSVFSDRLLSLNPILDPPKILSYSPADSLNEVSNVSKINVQFDIRMNPDETQKAFSITPNVSGSLTWDSEFKILTFTPSKGYTQGTKYTVKISTTAKTHFGINLTQNKIFTFKTRSQFNLISTYPKNNFKDLSTTLMFSLRFDNALDGTTLSGKISLTDSLGSSIPVTVNQSRYNVGIIEFEPKQPLNYNSLYRLTIKDGIGDIEYVKTIKTDVIEFRTEKKLTFTGFIVDNFENENSWVWPNSNPNTKGQILDQTSFFATSDKKINGQYSGKLEYAFSGSNGIIELALEKPVKVVKSNQNEFGVWVFGDNSKNILEYRFIPEGNSSTEIKVTVDSVNWTGWKMKKINLGNILFNGNIEFKSIDIVQTINGEKKGKIFFDDCITNIVTDVKNKFELPTEFSLEQNYPNPFGNSVNSDNPKTTIRYNIPNQIHNSVNDENNSGAIDNDIYVTLKIYDILGNEVATLVNQHQKPGLYSYELNSRKINLSSGVYFYRLEAGNFVAVKKMILMK